VIPGNDDALRAVRLFASRISDAIAEGNQIATEGGVAAEGGEPGAAPEGQTPEVTAEAGETNNGGAQPESATPELAESSETGAAPDESAESVVAAS